MGEWRSQKTQPKYVFGRTCQLCLLWSSLIIYTASELKRILKNVLTKCNMPSLSRVERESEKLFVGQISFWYISVILLLMQKPDYEVRYLRKCNEEKKTAAPPLIRYSLKKEKKTYSINSNNVQTMLPLQQKMSDQRIFPVTDEQCC